MASQPYKQVMYLIILQLVQRTVKAEIGDDPWYKRTSQYFSFNSLDAKNIWDYRQARSIPAYSKNGLELNGLHSWVDLGNVTGTCINNPDKCINGFTIAFWTILKDTRPLGIIMQIAKSKHAVGTTVYVNGGKLGVSINSPTVQRNVEVVWNSDTWTHVALFWNKTGNNLGILINAKMASNRMQEIAYRTFLADAPPHDLLILGSSTTLLENVKMAIDELAIWNSVLSQEEIGYIMTSRAVDGQLSAWSNFSACSATCSWGTKTRTRSCTDPRPQHGGNTCNGLYNDTLPCILRPCPIHGDFSQWSNFGLCSKRCGVGQMHRNRTCTNPAPKFGGKNCSRLGPSFESKHCNTLPCPLHGGYSDWSNFSECSASCNNGIKTRIRTCSNPLPQHGGRNCSHVGPSSETTSCFLKVCPVDGNYSNWSEFGECDKSCSGGLKKRKRKCNNPTPVGDGNNCSVLGPSVDWRSCNSQPCPVNGNYTAWSRFSPCMKSCGVGAQFRYRNCSNPIPSHGGRNCSHMGPMVEFRACKSQPCPVDGRFGEWSEFSSCSRTCGSGSMRRNRVCDNPSPGYGGRDCSLLGSAVDIQVCNSNKCPDISFITSLTFLGETFHSDLFRKSSTKFKRLSLKIQYNVRKVYDESSSLHKIDVKWCGSGDNRMALCVLQFVFLDAKYNGIVELQDALLVHKMLHSMPVMSHFLTSKEVPSYAPKNVMAFNTSARSIMVRWQPSNEQQVVDKHILGYRIIYQDEQKGVSWSTIVSGENSAYYEIKRLAIYTRYCVRVMAYNHRGDGVASFPKCLFTDASVPDGPPTNITVYCISTTELVVRWESPLVEHMYGELRGYRLTYRPADNSTSGNFTDVEASTRQITLSGLQTYTRYVISVAAFNQMGLGVQSEDIIGVTEEDVPRKPPKILAFYNTSSTSLLVAWEPLRQKDVRGQLLGYRIFYKNTEAKTMSGWTSIIIKADSTKAEITGLSMYTKYAIQISGFNSKGQGSPSKVILVETDEDVPSQPPRDLAVANTSSTSLLVRWSPVPRSHQNGIIRGYKILYKESSDRRIFRRGVMSNYIIKTVKAGTIATELRNLTKYTLYEVAILAFTSKGDGVMSPVVTLSTAEDVPSKSPTFLKIFNTSSTSLRVTWESMPQLHVHGVLRGYVLLYRALNETEEMYDERLAGPQDREMEVNGLWKYTWYGIRVMAFTEAGRGVVSNEVVVLTDEDVPSWPPESVSAANKSSPTKIPVRWKPISNSYYIHGILRGYVLSYKAVVSNPSFKEEERNLTVGPNDLSIELRDLSPFTVYSIQVMAFTVKGKGKASPIIYGATCNCYKMLHTNYQLNPPYTYRRGANLTGIIPEVLKLSVKRCCGDCHEHGASQIDFRHSGFNKEAQKRGYQEVKQELDDNTALHFPLHESSLSTDYSFVSIVESAGVAFIVTEPEPGESARLVVRSVFELWPLVLSMLISAFLSGVIMWLLDSHFNINEFPSSPFRGPLEGMWWAFVTMTTLGFGDRVPKAVHSRIFAIFWIICGLVIVALVMSFVTTSLTVGIITPEIAIYGTKIAAIRDTPAFRLGITLNAQMDNESQYLSLRDVYTALNKRKVKGALIDAYALGSQKKLFNNDQLRLSRMLDHQSSYGVVMAGEARKLEICFREYLKYEKASVYEIISNNVESVESLQRNVAAQKTKNLFDAGSVVYKETLFWCVGLIGVLSILGIIYELVTRKKRDPNPKRYDYKDYLEYLEKQDSLYVYKSSKEAMKQILDEFHASCRKKIKELRVKHKRELRQLARVKEEEQRNKKEEKPSSLLTQIPNRVRKCVDDILPQQV